MRSLLAASLLLAAALFSLPGADLNRRAPEFAIKLPGGKQLLLSEFRGRIVMLEFLLTTCPHCQRTSRAMNQLLAEYAPRGVRAIGVAINDQAEKLVPEYVQQFGLTYPVGMATHEASREFLQHPPMVSMMMPQLVFIDRAGIIRAHYPGTDKFFQDEEKNIRAMLDSLLQPPAAKKAAPGKAN